MTDKMKVDEYYQLTVIRLKNYPQYVAMLNTAIINRDTAQAKLGEVSSPISRYTEKTASGTDGLTGPESYAERQQILQHDIWLADKTITKLKNIVQPLSWALSTLTPEESKVISLRFWGLASPANIGAFDYAGIRGIKWEEFDGHGISRMTAIRLCAKAQWKIRDIIFPCRRDEGIGVIIAE